MDQRRTQRYRLQLPLHIRQLGNEPVSRAEKTRNISSGGVCFVSTSQVDVGGRIEYVVTLSGGTLSGGNPPVYIRCLGKVLRSEDSFNDGVYDVAVTMERYSFFRPSQEGQADSAGAT